MRTIVRGGRIVTASQDYGADILIEDGTISTIGHLGEVAADRVVDASGLLVLPGAVMICGIAVIVRRRRAR